jgi:hypothetical protein
MDAQRSYVRARLAADPKHTKMSVIVEFNKLAFMDSSNAKLSLDRRDQRWSLKKSTSQRLQSAGKLDLAAREFVVEPNDTDVFLSCTLLGLNESCGAVDANNEAAGDLRIKGPAVACLLYPLFQIVSPRNQSTR